MDLLEPKLIHLKCGDFYISKLPCMIAREVFLRYLVSNVNIIELSRNYAASSGDIATKMLSYTAKVLEDGRSLRLENNMLLNQHVTNFSDLGKLEWEMLVYNFTFLDKESWLPYLSLCKTKMESQVIKILTVFAGSLLKKKSQPFKSYGQSTP